MQIFRIEMTNKDDIKYIGSVFINAEDKDKLRMAWYKWKQNEGKCYDSNIPETFEIFVKSIKDFSIEMVYFDTIPLSRF